MLKVKGKDKSRNGSAHCGVHTCEIESHITNTCSCPTMALDANLLLTLKNEILKVKVKDKGRKGKCSQWRTNM